MDETRRNAEGVLRELRAIDGRVMALTLRPEDADVELIAALVRFAADERAAGAREALEGLRDCFPEDDETIDDIREELDLALARLAKEPTDG